jgi:hypothetical protein
MAEAQALFAEELVRSAAGSPVGVIEDSAAWAGIGGAATRTERNVRRNGGRRRTPMTGVDRGKKSRLSRQVRAV